MTADMVLKPVRGVNKEPGMYRYALFYAPPPGAALAEFGARWLGRDLHGGAVPALPALAGASVEQWRRAVAAPRRYGFHATLKPPFRLAAGCDEPALLDALEGFCRARGPAPVGKLALRVLSGFLVLAPLETGEPDPVAELASDCVREFEPFRAPPTAAEIARRRPERLTAAEMTNLERWGYPYVMADFRFHLTLTGRLDEAGRARFGVEIGRMAGPAIAEPVEIAAICLCGQESPESDFRVLRRFPLGRAAAV